MISIRFIFILGISTGNSNRRWQITGSLEEALDVVKKHEIEETVRFNIYSSTKDFGVTGKNGLILSFKIRDQLQILLFSILNKNLQKVATEIYKVSKGFLPPLIAELFEPRNKHPYDIRYVSQFDTPSVNTVLMALRASLSQDPKFGTFCQMNSWIFKD